MKILHISTFDGGGAGLCCIRLHKGLLEKGYKSKVLVLQKTFDDLEVYKYEKSQIKLPKIFRWPILFVRLVFQKFRIPTSQRLRLQYKLDSLRKLSSPKYTLPLSEYDLSSHPLVKDADLVHLHWVAGFLDYPSFFSRISKPVIWTIHDENLYYGGFHYHKEKDSCISEYRKLEEKLIEIKQRSIFQCKYLSIVSLSKMMFELSLSNNIVKDRKHYIIHNSVDPGIFVPFDKNICRTIFNLPQDKTIIIFISYYLNEQNKGFKELVIALSELNIPDIALYAIGLGKTEISTQIDIYYSGPINEPRLLTLAYSAADFFIMPSFQEAFAQTPLEALACGLPVVAFPCSGTSELIIEKNGIRTNDFTIEALKAGILKVLNTEYDSKWIREDVIKRFGIKSIVEQYSKVYKETMSK